MNSKSTPDAFLQLDGVGFVSATYPRQEIDVAVNSTAISESTSSRKSTDSTNLAVALRAPVLKPKDFVESPSDDLTRKPNKPNNQ